MQAPQSYKMPRLTGLARVALCQVYPQRTTTASNVCPSKPSAQLCKPDACLPKPHVLSGTTSLSHLWGPCGWGGPPAAAAGRRRRAAGALLPGISHCAHPLPWGRPARTRCCRVLPADRRTRCCRVLPADGGAQHRQLLVRAALLGHQPLQLAPVVRVHLRELVVRVPRLNRRPPTISNRGGRDVDAAADNH